MRDNSSTLRERPLPPKPPGISWRDYLILLLHIAAELEQSLMVQYLYSAYSLGGDHAKAEARKVQEWRDAILTVAREEMGHLLTVQNCLCLVGGPISFEREDYPWDTPYYPFEFCLEPFSIDSIAKYVFAEMPATFDESEKADARTAKEAVKVLGLKAGHPVGEIYDLIIDIISDPEKIPDTDFNPKTYGIQATFDEWGRNYRPGPYPPHVASTDAPPPHERKTRVIITQMATRTEAVAALKDVAGQGEAPHHRGDRRDEPSHFSRFAKIFRELQAIQKRKKGWSPARRVARNPVVSAPGYGIKGATPITGEPARTWAALFNIRYRMLLSYLTHTFQMRRLHLDKPDTLRPAILVKVFGEMYNLKAIAGILVRLPLAGARDPRRAGPPFQMPYTVELPPDEADVWRQHRDLVDGSRQLVDALMDPATSHPKDVAPEAARYLAILRDLDLQSTVFIDEVLAGMKPVVRRARS